MVGSAILRRLQAVRDLECLVASRRELDLRDQAAVNRWFDVNRPELVFLVAGTVGGILAIAVHDAIPSPSRPELHVDAGGCRAVREATRNGLELVGTADSLAVLRRVDGELPGSRAES